MEMKIRGKIIITTKPKEEAVYQEGNRAI